MRVSELIAKLQLCDHGKLEGKDPEVVIVRADTTPINIVQGIMRFNREKHKHEYVIMIS